MTTNPAGTHAVIVGASMAGLLAAAATAPYYQRVTLLEREVLPPAGQGRRAVPQGRHVHAFLPGGLRALDKLLPGLPDAMVAAGAIRCESMREIRMVIAGHPISRAAMGADNLLASRPFFEGQVRTRVLGLPNVELRDGATVDGLVPNSEGRRVAGVRVSTTDGASTIEADLVIVANGRAGQVPAWLKAFGCPTPDTDELVVDLMYEHGISGMRERISDTAVYGDVTRGPRVVDEAVRARLKDILAEIQDGRFAKEWVAENEAGRPNHRRLLEEGRRHPIEEVGRRLRAMMPWFQKP